MSPGATFERVYAALKEQLRSGRFAPGDQLEPAAIGYELNASITPVRDALHRLVGERMVEAPRNDGFRVPSPTEAEVRDLYGWNLTLLGLASRASSRRKPVPRDRRPGPDQADRESAGSLFREIARRAGNPELERAVGQMNDRLAALRVAETRLFDDLEEELGGLLAALRDGDPAALRHKLAAYHRRRQRAAPELLLIARLPQESGPAGSH